MSIDRVGAINLRCDRCNRLFVLAGASLFWRPDIARDAANRRGWSADSEADFCDRCINAVKVQEATG